MTKKLGRELRVGDVLRYSHNSSFLILGFRKLGEEERIALNCWDEGVVVVNDREYVVRTEGQLSGLDPADQADTFGG